MSNITLVEGINLALARAMEEDERVVVLGEDVGLNGGVFRATAGLQQRLGPERVADTPRAEGLIAGQAFVLREGARASYVSWGAMLHTALEAADELEAAGIEAEVIVRATPKPIAFDTALASVRKTGRCVVITEAPRPCSLASEISAN